MCFVHRMGMSPRCCRNAIQLMQHFFAWPSSVVRRWCVVTTAPFCIILQERKKCVGWDQLIYCEMRKVITIFTQPGKLIPFVVQDTKGKNLPCDQRKKRHLPATGQTWLGRITQTHKYIVSHSVLSHNESCNLLSTDDTRKSIRYWHVRIPS